MYSRMIYSRNLFVLSILIGTWAAYLFGSMFRLSPMWTVGVGVLVLAFFYVTIGWSMSLLKKWVNIFNQTLDNIAMEIIIGAIAGMILGILVGFLSSFPLAMIRGAGVYLAVGFFIVCLYLGAKVGIRRAFDFCNIISSGKGDRIAFNQTGIYKVLDTSAIIDGRIYDVCLSSFLEGPLIVPTFVIEELQHIADSSDTIRRNKGRRGLELLSKMQKHPEIKIDIIEANTSIEKEVDAKLISLCKNMEACIITNDYNLNKVAELQGIKVLNINELTNAVKIIVYPGESLRITVIKEGKELGQGVGYLEDGTMVVIEDASNEIGHELDVLVTSVFQTAAGRMIFTKKTRAVQEENAPTSNSLQNVTEVNLYG